MAMWRCPHCGTPQAETARCWVCSKSTVSCSSCRDFRRSVAGRLGYCARDRRRSPLVGEEVRPCWQGAAAVAVEEGLGIFAVPAHRDGIPTDAPFRSGMAGDVPLDASPGIHGPLVEVPVSTPVRRPR